MRNAKHVIACDAQVSSICSPACMPVWLWERVCRCVRVYACFCVKSLASTVFWTMCLSDFKSYTWMVYECSNGCMYFMCVWVAVTTGLLRERERVSGVLVCSVCTVRVPEWRVSGWCPPHPVSCCRTPLCLTVRTLSMALTCLSRSIALLGLLERYMTSC